MDEGEETPLFFYSNSTLIFMSKFCMEACLPMSYEMVVQRKEGNIFSYHVPKRPNILKKISARKPSNALDL